MKRKAKARPISRPKLGLKGRPGGIYIRYRNTNGYCSNVLAEFKCTLDGRIADVNLNEQDPDEAIKLYSHIRRARYEMRRQVTLSVDCDRGYVSIGYNSMWRLEDRRAFRQAMHKDRVLQAQFIRRSGIMVLARMLRKEGRSVQFQGHPVKAGTRFTTMNPMLYVDGKYTIMPTGSALPDGWKVKTIGPGETIYNGTNVTNAMHAMKREALKEFMNVQ